MPREEKDNAIKLPLLAISPDMASFGGVVFRRVAQDSSLSTSRFAPRMVRRPRC
jgi:hypothetical protein